MVEWKVSCLGFRLEGLGFRVTGIKDRAELRLGSPARLIIRSSVQSAGWGVSFELLRLWVSKQASMWFFRSMRIYYP